MRTFFFHVAITLVVFTGGVFLGSKKSTISNRSSRLENERLEASYALQAMQWYNNQRAYPFGHIPEEWREKAYKHIQQNNFQKSSSSTSLSWSELGPVNIGGRVRSIVIDPTNSNVMYCGSVSGGIWKTTNAGTSWSPISDVASNLVIGCLAIDPTNSSVIYAGTGEGYFNVDALRGAGVLKSTDAGASWALKTNFSTPDPNYGYYYINKLVIRSDNTSVIFAALDGGIWKSTDAGTSWTKLAIATTSSFCVDLVADPTNANIMYSAFGLFATDGIYKTTNGGSGWTKLSGGLPTAGYNRISLAIAPSNASIVYAVFDSATTHQTHSIQKSTDGGVSWNPVTKPSDVSTGETHLGGQGWYNNVITVHPTDPNTVVIGGIDLFKTTNGGNSWTQVSDPSGPPKAHVDQHALVFDKTNTNLLYVGNDGGMFKSTNSGSTFFAVNNNLGITQMYSAAVHPTLTTYLAGSQDNGTVKSTGTTSWTQVFPGDGGFTAIDFTTPTTMYTEYVYLCIQKSTSSGVGGTWSRMISGIPAAGNNQGDGTSDRCEFIAPFVMDPSNSQNLVAGTYKIYRTTNGAGMWSAISGDLTGDAAGQNATITAIAVAKTSSATIYVGTSGSTTATAKVQVTTNTGSTWNDVTGTLPDRHVKSFAIEPGNASHAYVTFSGYGTSHVYRTVNTGVSWTNASGDLPDLPVNAIVIDPANSSHLIVGTDLGIFESVNAGTNWTQQTTGFPNVSVDDLDLRSDAVLFAATHGRGLFKTNAPVAVQDDRPSYPTNFSLAQNFPNPFNPTTKISFSITDRSLVRLQVFDDIGREVAALVNQELSPGTYDKVFDGSGFASGVYYYTLTAGKDVLSKKMLLLK